MKFEIKIDDHAKSAYVERLKGNSCGAIDLRAIETYCIQPGSMVMIHTGFSIWIRDPSLVGLVSLRSSSGKSGMRLANGVGVIDCDYQGEIGLLIQNMTKEQIVIQGFDRIAQLVITENVIVDAQFVDKFSYDTKRGSGGFGSTGKQ